MFYKIYVIKYFAKFRSQKLVLESLFHKVTVLGLQRYLKEIPAQEFSCEFFKNIKNPFFHRTPLVATSKTMINRAAT